MCCEPRGPSVGKVHGECPDCGADTIDGEAINQCGYSPTECDTCGSAPCDQSC
jgi:hypothetical protein